MFIFKPVARTVSLPLTYIFDSGTSVKHYNGQTISSSSAYTPSVMEYCSASLGGNVYLFGGSTGSSNSNAIYVYDGTTRTTSSAHTNGSTVNTGAASLPTYTVLGGGKTMGGFAVDFIQFWDGTTMSAAGFGLESSRYDCAATANGTYAYFYGGFNGSLGSSTIQHVDNTARTTDSAITGGSYTWGGQAGYLPTTSLMYFSYGANSYRFISYDGSTVTVISTSITTTLGGPNGFWASSPALIFAFDSSTTSIKRYDGTSITTDSATITAGAESACYSGTQTLGFT